MPPCFGVQVTSETPACAACGRPVPLGAGYVVRIEVFADPELPEMTAEQIAAMDLDAAMAGLLEQMKRMSAEELQDGVHRQFEYRLCPLCHRRYLANPLRLAKDT